MINVVNKCVLLDNNNTYKIAYSITLEEVEVFYLINVKDISDIKFCYKIDDETFEEIRDKDILADVVDELTRGATLFYK